MHRLTARVLLVLLLVGLFVPVALAIAAAPPHACCVRKAMHGRPSHDSEFNAPQGCCQHDCCRTLTVAQWAHLNPSASTRRTPPSASLQAELRWVYFAASIKHAPSGRAPPQFSIA
jgi:hypothetical protein